MYFKMSKYETFYSRKVFFSFVNWFHLISAFLFENTQNLHWNRCFCQTTDKVYVAHAVFEPTICTIRLHRYLTRVSHYITLKSVSSAIYEFWGRCVNCCLIAGVTLGFYRPQIFSAERCLDKIGSCPVSSSTTFCISFSVAYIDLTDERANYPTVDRNHINDNIK